MTASSTKRSDDRQRKMKAIATTANVTAIADRRSKMKRLPTKTESDRDDRHGHWQITGDARRKHNETGFSRHIAGAAAVGANKRRHGTSCHETSHQAVAARPHIVSPQKQTNGRRGA